MITLHLDVSITRRQRMHHCLDDHETVLFSASKSGDCFAWLWENGHHRFNISIGSDTGVTDTMKLGFMSQIEQADKP